MRRLNAPFGGQNEGRRALHINRKKARERQSLHSTLTWISVAVPLLVLLLVGSNLAQEPASPVFQNHKTKEWTNLDNITFSFDCKRRSVGFYADMEYNCQVSEIERESVKLCAACQLFSARLKVCYKLFTSLDISHVRRGGQSNTAFVRQRDELQSGIQNMRLGLQFQLHRVAGRLADTL